MTIGYDPGTAPEQLSKPTWPGFPTTSAEFITLIAHYYRAEIARMAGWRDRIDRTSNWAITVVGACCRSRFLRQPPIMVSSCLRWCWFYSCS